MGREGRWGVVGVEGWGGGTGAVGGCGSGGEGEDGEEEGTSEGGAGEGPAGPGDEGCLDRVGGEGIACEEDDCGYGRGVEVGGKWKKGRQVGDGLVWEGGSKVMGRE